MGFEDAAKRLRGGRGGAGESSTNTGRDPDEIMAEAQAAAERSATISDLILGPMLLLGGAGILFLCYKVAGQGAYMYGLGVAALVAIVTGSQKLLRGVGILRRSADRDD